MPKPAKLSSADMGRPETELRFYSVNVADAASVNAAFDQIVKDFGRLDVLVNNAGITQDTLLLRMKEEQWDRVLDVNLKGTFLCIQAAAPVMLRQRSGRIINLASVVGMMGNAGQANYCASKAGVIGLTKSAGPGAGAAHPSPSTRWRPATSRPT